MSRKYEYEQIGVAMTCRSFEEYKAMFMLEEPLLRKGKILDVASGASSFTAELTESGYDAVAVDPLYHLTEIEIGERGHKEMEEATQKLVKNKDVLEWGSYGSLENHDEIRRKSLNQFLRHYRKDTKKESYIPAALPSLPFKDGTFSLVLCNHFLFLYQDQFDFEFHLHAIKELIRVTKPEGVIRIYPLVGFKNELYPDLDELLQALGYEGIQVDIMKTDFRFVPKATHFLNIKKLG